MNALTRITTSRSARNLVASYVNTLSLAAFGLLSIPMAVHYLEGGQIGLWVVTNSIVGYLQWMGQGIGPATSRMIAPAVAAGDREEIDGWWSSGQAALCCQGILIVVVGLLLRPWIIGFFDLSGTEAEEGERLLFWATLILGIGLPVRGAAGILTAQERFHLTQLVQSLALWINLLGFWILLRSGAGIMAYVGGQGLAVFTLFVLFRIVLRKGANPPRFRIDRVAKDKLRRLLSFGVNVGGQGIAEAVFNTLPALVLAKFGGLALAPLFSFTWRGPQQLAILARKVAWAYYPRLLRLKVENNHELFVARHRKMTIFVWAFSLCFAGGVIAFNRTLVEYLAGLDYFAGPAVNAVMAGLVILEPTSRLYECLLPASGQMKGVGLLALLTIVVGTVLSVIAYDAFGLWALVSVLGLLPLVMGSYGFFKGGRECGFAKGELSRRPVLFALVGVAASLLAFSIPGYGAEGPEIWLLGRMTHLPGAVPLLVGATFAAVGAAVMFRTGRELMRS